MNESSSARSFFPSGFSGCQPRPGAAVLRVRPCCSIMWRSAASLCRGAPFYMDVTNILRVCLTPFWHVAMGILWLKPDCACPTPRGQKNRLQLRILRTRGKYRNVHVCHCSICSEGLFRGIFHIVRLLFKISPCATGTFSQMSSCC